MNYREVQRAEMQPDVYDGATCDGIKPQWVTWVEKEGKTVIPENIELDPEHFMPGTRVIIMVPECPECSLSAEDASGVYCECGFNWEEWMLNEYS